MMDESLSDVVQYPAKRSKLRVKFMKCDETNRHLIVIDTIGDPSNYISKVTPEHIAKYPAEWAAYEKGLGEPDVQGTSLLEVPGITKHMIPGLKLKGVRVAEELAVLDAHAAQSLGLNGMTLAKSAKNMLAARELETLKALSASKGRKAETSVGA